MDVHAFDGGSADDVWLQAAQVLGDPALTHRRDGDRGPTREILNGVFTLKDPRQRWVLARRPAINPAFAIAEVLWMINGEQESRVINFFNRNYARYAGADRNYYGAYGRRLRRHFRFDQLDRAYRVLSSDPHSRQAVLQIWDPRRDAPHSSGKRRSADIPCNVSSILKLVDGRLEWLQVLRSNDLYLGVPYNFIQWTTVQEVLAGWLGVELGEYVHVAHSLHVYESDMEAVASSTHAPCILSDQAMSLPKPESEAAFRDMYNRVFHMIMCRDDRALIKLAEGTHLPPAFRNWLFVISAEAARRFGWSDASSHLISQCSNPVLVAAWNRWMDRWTGQA